MSFNNIKDLLIKSLNKTNKEDKIISSIIYNSIINDFLNIKKIDIKGKIISIKLNKNIILLKTNSPILNSEILTIKNILIQNIKTKLDNINYKIINLDIKLK
ncbi:hypothetical protein H3C61_01810 [Candidatus Gracilibacteria bacterium]|nr:hypothetical protein [Candidatus Gracilibacteria bacterium]